MVMITTAIAIMTISAIRTAQRLYKMTYFPTRPIPKVGTLLLRRFCKLGN